jgi:tetratricopeptide (TPR) repeat protein
MKRSKIAELRALSSLAARGYIAVMRAERFHESRTRNDVSRRDGTKLVAVAIGVVLCSCSIVACGEGAGSGTESGSRATTETPFSTPTSEAFSRATFDDATRAIETYIAANRTREAELVARKLVEQADSDPVLGRIAHEYAARAYFARAELAEDLSPKSRDELVREAALAAQRAVAESTVATTTATTTTATTTTSASTSGATSGANQPSVESRRFAAMLADRVGDHDIAQSLYDAALAEAPNDLATILPAALSALARNAQDPRIDELAARHERLAPDAAWSAALRAEIALARGEAAAALASAEAALTRDRDMLEMRLVLAKALRANGRPRDAARLLSALSESERAKPAITQQFALALAEAGETTQAAAAWDAAIRATPNDPYLRAEAAVAFLRAGNEARAASELAALEALFGGSAQRARIEPTIRLLRERKSS